MKTLQFVISGFLSLAAANSFAGDRLESVGPVTNLVEVLPYVERFAKALDLEIPQPLTTNDVTRYNYAKFTRTWGIHIRREWSFTFTAQDRVIDGFTDNKHSMAVLWRKEDIQPLMKPSKLTKKGALELAWKYLHRLGYHEKDLPLMPPNIKPWFWEPVGENVKEPLPYFTIQWAWSKYPDITYLTIEVDGLRERIVSFATLYPRKERGPPPPYE